MTLRSSRIAPWLLCAAALLFTILGLMLTPLAGIDDDEALFAAPLFTGANPLFSLSIFGHHPPLMVFAYTGALKTYLYWPVFKIFPPGPYSLRIPVLLAGTLTILLFYFFARRIAGEKAALIAALLLACDPTFLMSNTFDWGPVALQHLLLVTGLCLLVTENYTVACLVFGLALWEKSVFLWALAGLAAGGWLAYRSEIFKAVSRARAAGNRRIAYAALAFVIGASPLIVYNIKSKSETVRTTAHFSLDHLPRKVLELGRALDGSGMFRFLAAESWEVNAKPTASAPAHIADAIHDLTGDRRSSLFLYAAILALAAFPLWWREPFRKPALFSIGFCAAAFAAMAITRDAGEAIHHTVLLWPMPQLFVGVALAAIPWRWIGASLAAVLAVSGLLVINQYLFQLEHFGADGAFTDAIYALSQRLPAAAEDKLYIMDWGMTQTLTLLHQGKLPLTSGSDPFLTAEPDAMGERIITNMLSDPHALFVGHVREREVFSGVGQRLDDAASAAGYRKQMVQTVTDSTGRPVFQVFRFDK